MKNIISKIIAISSLLIAADGLAQSVGIGTTTPNVKSILELSSTTQGLLPPRMTTAERTGIAPGVTEYGLVVYDTDLNDFYYWDGSAWTTMGGSDSDWLTLGNNIYNGNAGNVGVQTTNPLSSFQIGRIFHFDTVFVGNPLPAILISNNLRFNGSGFEHTESGKGQFLYMSDEEFGVELHGDAPAGSMASDTARFTMSWDGARLRIRNPVSFDPALQISAANGRAISIDMYDSLGFSKPSTLGFISTTGWAAHITANDIVNQDYTLKLPSDLPTVSGDVLASDLSGNLFWTSPGGMPAGSQFQTMYHDGTNWLSNDFFKIDDPNGVSISKNLSIVPNSNYDLYLYRDNADVGPGRYGIYSYREGNSGIITSGNSWANNDVDAAIGGVMNWGNEYSAGVYGATVFDYDNSAAVLGADNGGGTYGALGYRNFGATFAGYFQGDMYLNGAFMPNNNSGAAGEILVSQGAGSPPIWQANSSFAGWELAGNAISGGEVLGTTNAQNLEIVAGGLNAIEIDDATQNIGIGVSPSNAYKIYVDIPNTNTTVTRGIYNVQSYSGASNKEAIYNSVSADGTGANYGVRNDVFQEAGENSNAYGDYNRIDHSGTGGSYGEYNIINSTGSGVQYGIVNSLNNTGTSVKYGVLNDVRNSTSGADLHGTYNDVAQNSTGASDGVYNSVEGTGSGVQTGVHNWMSNTGTGMKRGVYNDLRQTAGANQLRGVYNYIDHDGTGFSYGVYTWQRGTGSGIQYGTYSNMNNTGSGDKYGSYKDIRQTDAGINNRMYGDYNTIVTAGNGETRGTFNANSSTGSGTQYGVYNSLNGAGTGNRTGIYNYVNQTNAATTAIMYGANTYVNHSGSSGTSYGDYIQMQGANVFKYGLYVTGEDRNYLSGNLQLMGDFRPGGAPGTSGQILVSQGTNNAPQWQDASAASANIYSTNGTLSSDRLVTMGGNDLAFNGGNIGVGITSPTNHFSMFDANAHYLQVIDDITGSASGDGIRLGVNGAGYGYMVWGETTSDFSIGTSGDNNLLKFGGATDNVAIGIGSGASPNTNYRLEVEIPNTDTDTEYGVRVENYSGSASNKYGLYSYASNDGGGSKYGVYGRADQLAGEASGAFGFYSYTDHDGTGSSYLYYGNSAGSTSGTEYGIYMFGEDINYLSGTLGVGTSAPATVTDIQGFNTTGQLRLRNTTSAAWNDGNGYTRLRMDNAGSTDYWLLSTHNKIGAETDANSNFNIYTNTYGNILTATGQGNVGVRNTSPSYPLDVNGLAHFETAIGVGVAPFASYGVYSWGSTMGGRFEDNNSTGRVYLAYGDYGFYQNGGTRNYMRDDLGLGTSTPSYLLHLASNSAAKPTSSTWTVASDMRLKKDVKEYKGGLEEIMKIRPVWFTYNGKANMPEETGVGIIAQELKEVAPYMVHEWKYEPVNNEEDPEYVIKDNNPGTYLGVDNGAMTYMLINATKEQQKIIETQEQKINDLQSQIDELRQLIGK